MLVREWPSRSHAKRCAEQNKPRYARGACAALPSVYSRDEWLGDGVHGEKWRDTSVRFTGPVVRDAQQAFAENWQEAGGALLPIAEFPDEPRDGATRIAFVASTASQTITRAERLTLLAIAAAHHRLWVTNAYFVPSNDVVKLLERKAASGIDVRIRVPGDHDDSKGRSCSADATCCYRARRDPRCDRANELRSLATLSASAGSSAARSTRRRAPTKSSSAAAVPAASSAARCCCRVSASIVASRPAAARSRYVGSRSVRAFKDWSWSALVRARCW